jgi:hypothetical protein
VKRPLLILGAAGALLLAACSSGGGESQSAASTTATIPVETTAPTTTTVPTTTSPKQTLGVTQKYASTDGEATGNITVYRYRDAAVYGQQEATLRNDDGKRSVAIEVKVCVTKYPENENPYVSWEPWSLGDDAGGSYEAWASYPDDSKVQPLYPQDKTTPVGTCRRGWVVFEVTKNAKPTFVEYNTGDGNVLKWPLKG